MLRRRKRHKTRLPKKMIVKKTELHPPPPPSDLGARGDVGLIHYILSLIPPHIALYWNHIQAWEEEEAIYGVLVIVGCGGRICFFSGLNFHLEILPVTPSLTRLCWWGRSNVVTNRHVRFVFILNQNSDIFFSIIWEFRCIRIFRITIVRNLKPIRKTETKIFGWNSNCFPIKSECFSKSNFRR